MELTIDPRAPHPHLASLSVVKCLWCSCLQMWGKRRSRERMESDKPSPMLLLQRCRQLVVLSGQWVHHAVDFSWAASSLNLLRRVIVALAVSAGAVESYQAPPATTFLQALHLQIPTADLFTESYFTRDVNKRNAIAYLSAEWARVSCSLSDLELFDGFSLSRTISSSVFAEDANLLCSLCHYYIYINQ